MAELRPVSRVVGADLVGLEEKDWTLLSQALTDAQRKYGEDGECAGALTHNELKRLDELANLAFAAFRGDWSSDN